MHVDSADDVHRKVFSIIHAAVLTVDAGNMTGALTYWRVVISHLRVRLDLIPIRSRYNFQASRNALKSFRSAGRLTLDSPA